MSLPLIEREPSRNDSHRVPHRHATPSAPWSWTDLDDGVSIVKKRRVSTFILVLIKFIEVDPMQLEYPLPPIPMRCDHNPGRCNRCWTGYPQSLFPQWTTQQIRKANIYEAVHNSPEHKPCICYRLDVDKNGFFTNFKEMIAKYGDENMVWDQMIREQVS